MQWRWMRAFVQMRWRWAASLLIATTLLAIALLGRVEQRKAWAAPAAATARRAPSEPFLGMTVENAGRLPSRRLRLVNAFPNLAFQDPTMILPVPRSNLLCVIGREGTVETFVNQQNVTEKTM